MVPRTVQMTPVTRDSLAIEYVIDVGVQKKLPADGADAAIDELLVLVGGDRGSPAVQTAGGLPRRGVGRDQQRAGGVERSNSSSTGCSPAS